MNSKFPPLLILKSYVLSSYTANIRMQNDISFMHYIRVNSLRTLFIPRQVLLKNITEVSLRHRHHVFYHFKSSVVLKDLI